MYIHYLNLHPTRLPSPKPMMTRRAEVRSATFRLWGNITGSLMMSAMISQR